MRSEARMLGRILIVVFAIATIVSSRPQEERGGAKFLKCPTTSSCMCIEHSEMEIQCPKFDPQVFIRVQPNNYIHFECENVTNKEYELVPEINLEEVRSLHITKCPLPHGKSVASYLKNIHINRTRSFHFISSGVNRNIPIESQHFQGLGGIEHFDIRGMEDEIKELPADMFVGMDKLTWVRIRIANIKLPVDLFSPLVNLEFLELGHNKLQSLEPGLLRNQRKLSQLNLWGNSLRNLNKGSFEGLEQVKELDLSDNGMESLEPDVLAHLVNLTEINLSANHFVSLPDGLFATNTKLKLFKLLENRIPMETLPNGLLANLVDLTEIYIKCDLRMIPNDTFEGSIRLENISLSRNALTDLPDNLLADQAKLIMLDLSNNQLSQLPESLFIGTPDLRELKLSGNQIIEIVDYLLKPLTKLKILDLDNNLIESIDPRALMGLQSVHTIRLQNNRLTLNGNVGSPFQTLGQLRELNLFNNSLTEMFEDYTLTALRSLNLGRNKFSYLSIIDLQSVSRDGLTIDFSFNQIEEINFQQDIDASMLRIEVLLNNNPIKCDCKIFDFVKYLVNRSNDTEKQSNIKVRIGDMQCAKPDNMANVLVKSLKTRELVCPLDDESTSIKRCPEGCTCLVRPDDRHLLVKCPSSVNIDELPVASTINYQETELTLENGNLTVLPTIQSEGYKQVTKLIVNNNSIGVIELDNLPPKLKALNLENNNLKTLSEPVKNFIKNKTNFKLALSGNPWSCDCENLEFMNFVQELSFNNISDYDRMQCEDGANFFKNLTRQDLCPDDNNFIIIVSVIISLMGVVLGALAALYYKYQKQIKMWLYSHNTCLWFVTEEELDKDKRYDAFVSYSHRDQDFVADFLLPELENGTIPYKLCVHERDWSPGLEISTQISNSVNDAKRTIIVMSPNYLQSNWAQWEFRVAQSHAATEKRSRIIVILYGDIGDINKLEPDIRDYLKLNTYVKWGDKWFWHKLKYAMPHVKSSERVEKTTTGLVKTAMKSSVDDKLELIKPISVTPPQLTTPPAEKVANPLITSLNAKNANHNGNVHNGNGYNGHINGAFVINTSSRQSDV